MHVVDLNLTPERWRRIAGVMEVALELEPALRHIYLASISTESPELEKDVRALLVSFNQALDERGSTTLQDSRASERIGPYRLVKVIGQGGMGTVFLAERREEGLERKVALKVLHERYGLSVARQRFLSERRILASFKHPNIARMYDAGSTADGRPYLVIELVEGLPIDLYCQDCQLSVLERLQLFRQVCAAVAYAHQNLVVHRDIKPSNILITSDGEPKLLDFGIAKILDKSAFGSFEAPMTISSERPMTPSYASPEQIRGQPITTATDVFALGALLYELVTGCRPFRYPSAQPEVMAQVQEGSIMAPSQALIHAAEESGEAPLPRHWSRELDGDLDNIVLRALARPGEKRYSSVGALEEDLRRFLEGEPVLATENTLKYRLGKVFRRQKRTAILVVMTALSMVLGLTLGGRQVLELRNHRDLAVAAQERTELDNLELMNVSASIVDLCHSSSWGDPAPPKASEDERLVRALKRSLAYARGTAAEPEILKVVHRFQERRTAGLEPAERLLLFALPAVQEADLEGKARLAEAASLVAQALSSEQLHTRATLLWQRQIDLAEDVYGLESVERSEAFELLAYSQWHSGDKFAAIDSVKRSLEIQKRLNVPLSTLLSKLEFFGATLYHGSFHAEAVGFLEQALLLYDEEEKGPSTLTRKAVSLRILGLARLKTGDLAGARRDIMAAMKVFEGQSGKESPSLVPFLESLARLRYQEGLCEEALIIDDRACRLMNSVSGDYFGAMTAEIKGRVCEEEG